jgi:hypothetical protein
MGEGWGEGRHYRAASVNWRRLFALKSGPVLKKTGRPNRPTRIQKYSRTDGCGRSSLAQSAGRGCRVRAILYLCAPLAPHCVRAGRFRRSGGRRQDGRGAGGEGGPAEEGPFPMKSDFEQEATEETERILRAISVPNSVTSCRRLSLELTPLSRPFHTAGRRGRPGENRPGR